MQLPKVQVEIWVLVPSGKTARRWVVLLLVLIELSPQNIKIASRMFQIRVLGIKLMISHQRKKKCV